MEEHAEGKIEGRVEGELLTHISIIRKKIEKSCTIEEIADTLEQSVQYVSAIQKWLEKYPEENAADKHLKELQDALKTISIREYFILLAEERLQMEDLSNASKIWLYDLLAYLSVDAATRRGYEWRAKSLRDYDWQMECSERKGYEAGHKLGVDMSLIEINTKKGYTEEEIAEFLSQPIRYVSVIQEWLKKYPKKAERDEHLKELMQDLKGVSVD